MNCNCCGGEMKKKSVVEDQSTGFFYTGFELKCQRPSKPFKSEEFITTKEIVHKSPIQINGWIGLCAWPITSILIFSGIMWYLNMGFEDNGVNIAVGCSSILIGGIISIFLYGFLDFNIYKDVSYHSSVYFDQKQAHDRWLHEWICLSCGKSMIDSEYIPSQKIEGMSYYEDYIHAKICQEIIDDMIKQGVYVKQGVYDEVKKQQSSKEIIKNNTEFSFLDSEGNEQGTYTGDQIKDLLQDGTITDNTQIYIHGKLFEWRELSTFNYPRY